MNVVHIVSNRAWGGGERYALDLCCHSIAQGHKVLAVVRRSSREVLDRFAEAGIPVLAMSLSGALDFVTPVRLARLFDSIPDGEDAIIHVHNFKDAATALRARELMHSPRTRIKIICTRHLVAPARRDARHARLYRSLAAIVFVSALARDTFAATAPDGCAPMHVVHNALPHTDMRPHVDADNDNVRLVFTGRLSTEKGIETLIEALALISDARVTLRVCGTGTDSYAGALQRYARHLGVADKITWLGHVPDIDAEYARADIAVMPSIAQEAFGLAAAEAMMQRLPVITTANGAQREFITDGIDGILVPPADAAALAHAITQLADDPDLRDRIADAARRKALATLDYDNFYNRMMHIYIDAK